MIWRKDGRRTVTAGPIGGRQTPGGEAILVGDTRGNVLVSDQ